CDGDRAGETPQSPAQPDARRVALGVSDRLPALRAAAALLGDRHVDQADQRLSGGAAGLVPGAADHRALHGGALLLSRPAGTGEQPDHFIRIDGALDHLRHDDGVQPGALQHRGKTSRLLGAVAALSATGRGDPADLPAVPWLEALRHPYRPHPRLYVHDTAAHGLDDVRLFPPAAEIAGGSGA